MLGQIASTYLPAVAVKEAKFLDKKVEGQLRKYYQENVLLEQPFLVSTRFLLFLSGTVFAQIGETDDKNKPSVQTVLESESAKLGDKVQLSSFARIVVGEGIAAPKSLSFSEEVASKMNV